jgi:hypothetical protein
MANRYWVGGAGTWNTSSTTNWSASSGGASGASVPTAADSVFFDQAGTYTVTCTGALTCLDITVSAGTVTFANGTSPTFAISGSMSLLAGTVWSTTGAITFNATTTGKTVTTNGVALNSLITFNGVGGDWTLGSALTNGSGFTTVLTNGTLNLSSYTLSTGAFTSTNSNIRTINFGTGQISCTGAFNVWITTNTTNLTITGTGTINLTGASAKTFVGGGFSYSSITLNQSGAGALSITGSNTFSNLSVAGPSTAGVVSTTFDSNQTISGTLSTTGTAGNRRVFFASATYGIGFTLTVNSAPSLTDADFRDLYVKGTAAPISGTRIGNRGNCSGITFSTPKTVYWATAAGGNISGNNWAATSGGAVSTDNFPLPQDTATFVNTGLNTSANITFDSTVGFIGSVDFSARTNAVFINLNSLVCYGNLTLGSGWIFNSGSGTWTFSGEGTKTITSAGKTSLQAITVDTYGGTVQLADALNIGAGTNLTITNGTFSSQGYSVSIGGFFSNNGNVRTINLGASTLNIQSGTLNFSNVTNLTFNAGTSQVNWTAGSGFMNTGPLTFYNFSFTNNNTTSISINGSYVFNNLTFTAPASAKLSLFSIAANQTINGTLTCAGASAIRRIFLQSNTVGTQRTLTVNSLSANDCDFREIIIAGAAAGTAPTRAGDCGRNSGITFPSPKTVYWNLAGTQGWSATAWCTASGGTPDINQFPLPQDTAVFDNAGAAGTVSMDLAWNVGTFDASLRTSAMTFSLSTFAIGNYGDWKWGSGVTSTSTTGSFNFNKQQTQTFISNGVQTGSGINVNGFNTTLQLGDALIMQTSRGLALSLDYGGAFDAVTYNVTIFAFYSGQPTNIIRMGSGIWTVTCNLGNAWNHNGVHTNVYSGTATVVASNNTNSRTTVWNTQGAYFNKFTVANTAATGTVVQFFGSLNVGELASLKTVAYTITTGTTLNIGKWSVSGSAGNLVTYSGGTLIINGPANTGVDYLSVTGVAVSTSSPGEFYAGANSTNGGSNTGPIFFTAAPAPRTLYWVGGTGAWSSTTKWSTSSGGASGAAIPTSLDSVTFDSASNATAYTATVSGVTIARCAAFSMSGPAAGTATFAGAVKIAFHGNVFLAATNVAWTHSAGVVLSGNTPGLTYTQNGKSIIGNCDLYGSNATWTQVGSFGAWQLNIYYGTFDTGGYALFLGWIVSTNTSGARGLTLNNSTVTLSSGSPTLNISATNMNLQSGTSSIVLAFSSINFAGGGLTYYNVTFNYTSFSQANFFIQGANTFNNLTFTGLTPALGISYVTVYNNQTINGTFTLGAGSGAVYRTFLLSDTLGTTRTFAVNSLAAGASDIDFRDIAITGAAAPISGTRFGDAKGNSGITFPAAKTVYYRQTGSANWATSGAGSWSLTSGGAFDATAFPLAQDTAVFPAATYPASGSTTSVNAGYNIGTIDMSLRTTNTMNLNLVANVTIYKDWITGTGIGYGNIYTMTFSGRGSQLLTSAGRTIPHVISVDSPSGSVTLQDGLTLSFSSATVLTITQGTFNASTYNVTLTGSNAGVSSNNSNTRTIAVGSGTWTVPGPGTIWQATTATNLTVTGTGTISLTNAGAKTFAGGNISYSGITLNQGGLGALSITGNNTFANITKTAVGATTISLSGTTQRVGAFTATGTAGNLLTITGTSAGVPATLIYTGVGAITGLDYLVPTSIRAYSPTTTWYAGNNSTNGGTFGWIFASGSGTIYAVYITESNTASDTFSAAKITTYASSIFESNTASDTIAAAALFRSAVSDTANASDSAAAAMLFASSFSETANATDSISSNATFGSSVSDTARTTDSIAAQEVFGSSISESVTAVDSISAQEILYPAISETVSASETNAASATFISTVSDTATATDSVLSNASFSSAISDTVNVSDSPSAKAVFGSSVSDTVTVTDTPSAAQGFGTSVSEQANASQTTAAAQGFRTTIAEQANASETNSAAQGFVSNISEQVNANDSISAMAMFAGYLNESATASESNSAKAVFGSNVSDSVTVDGSPSTQAIFNSTTQDTAQALDSISAAATFRGAVSESATAQDSDSVAASTFNAAAADNMQASNTFSGQASFGATVSNTVNAADSNVGFIRFPSSISESATALDSVSAAQRFRTAIMESSQASNIFSAIEVFKSSISETVRASETNRGRVQFGSAVTDTARASETNRGRVQFGSAVNEFITITDSNVGFISFPGSISESAQATEQNSAKAVFTPIVSDGAAVSEFVATNFQVNSALLETAQASETSASNQGFGSAVSESATANGTVLARAIFQGIISEAAQGSDQFSTAAVFLAAFSEFAQVYAQDVGYLTNPASISESSTASDSVSAAGALRGYISESATGVDSISAKFFHATFINESAQGLDSVDAPGSIYNVITSEQAAVNALPSTNAIFYAAVIAYAGITDVATARYLWELIDNDQTSDWSNINDTQSAGWVEINDIQASNWQNVGNTQSSGWTEINDTQNPGWERITP